MAIRFGDFSIRADRKPDQLLKAVFSCHRQAKKLYSLSNVFQNICKADQTERHRAKSEFTGI